MLSRNALLAFGRIFQEIAMVVDNHSRDRSANLIGYFVSDIFKTKVFHILCFKLSDNSLFEIYDKSQLKISGILSCDLSDNLRRELSDNLKHNISDNLALKISVLSDMKYR